MRVSRRLFVDEVPQALNLADVVHHIGNTIKDMVKLLYFQKTIKIILFVVLLQSFIYPTLGVLR